MVDNYFVEVRRRNKLKFHQFIISHADIPMDKIIGLFSYQNGFKKSTLESWRDELIDAGVLKIDEHGVPE